MKNTIRISFSPTLHLIANLNLFFEVELLSIEKEAPAPAGGQQLSAEQIQQLQQQMQQQQQQR